MALNEQININTEKNITKEEAIAMIGVLLQECNVMGANDSEIINLMDLMKKVKQERVNPTDAVKEANSIRYSKMEYR